MRFYLFLVLPLICLFSCSQQNKKNNKISKITSQVISVDSLVHTDSVIDDYIKPFRDKMTLEIEKPLSYSTKNLVRTDGNMQSTLGNLMADMNLQIANKLYREKTGNDIDFAFFNYGGIRSGLPKGTIRVKHAFQLMPFENILTVVIMSGQKVKELFEYFIDENKPHPLSKTVNLILNKKKYSLLIRGRKFDINKTYSVLTSDYLQHGGDRMTFFKDPVKLIKFDYKIRDAIINYFSQTDTLKSVLDKRVVIK